MRYQHEWRKPLRAGRIYIAPMETQQLGILLKVVELGSFAAAARHFDLAPSVVTRAVGALERELGLRLLQRTTRRLALTDAGAAYCEHARAAMDALDRARDMAQATQGGVAGTVRITASVAYGQTVLVPLLPALHRQHPKLELDLLLTDATLDLVAERVDLALRLGPAVDSSMVGLRLAPVRFSVVASPEHLRSHGRPRVPADLARCGCLRFPLPGYRTLWSFRSADGQVEPVPVQGWLVLSTALALHRAALDGLGPAMLADWLVQSDLASGRLVDLFPDHEVTATGFDSAVWLLYPSRAFVPRRVRAAVDFLKQALQDV